MSILYIYINLQYVYNDRISSNNVILTYYVAWEIKMLHVCKET